MTTNNSFSIIIPHYNKKIKQVKFCLESLLVQNLNLLKEIIIVNDGSNEENKEALIKLVDDLTHTHTRQIIKLIHQENLGSAAARKTGFYYSTGDIILFVDSDDWICDKVWLDKLNKIFIENLDIEIISFNQFDVQKENDQIYQNNIYYTKKIIDINWYLWNMFRTNESTISICRFAYKRKCLENKEFWYSPKLPFEDIYFNACLLKQKYTAIVTNKIFYAYRVNNPESNLTNAMKLNIIQRLKIFNKWFLENEYLNINTSKIMKEYWIWNFTCDAILTVGFRNLEKIAKNENIFIPTRKEIKEVIKKYKPFKLIQNLCFYGMVLNPIIDVIIPKLYRKFFAKNQINI
ncbi:glycosyltransferase family A protein [Mycoplasmoides alvi]|uniref:glycosyltransferase family A protein n=1 Tax=Mycoplasmoides alvi TaxID=78580 RepID=UPI00051C09FF|nr:glycosyltransferase family 2 protein [Mycoplasmoides alvi]